MGMKPVCWLSGLLLVGLALPGCESCNCWGNKSHSQVPNGYAATTPPSSTGRKTWDNRGTTQPGGVAANGQRQPGVGTNASPVVRTSTNNTAPELNAIPQLPPSPANRSIVEKPLSAADTITRTTVPPTLNMPPDPDPATPLPLLPERTSAPPTTFEDRGGPSLTPPNPQLPPLPALPGRPPQPE